MTNKKDKDGQEVEDDALWDALTRDVKPIEREKSRPKQAKQVVSSKAPSRTTQPEHVVIPHKSKEEPGRELDRRSAEKLRKGQMPIEARLDLHGLNQEQAHVALNRFITKAHGAGQRCVLVITGKGAGSDGRRDPLSSGQGVLKRKVPEWLEEQALRQMVLKVQQARPQHGGEGALYVLLRRRR